MTEIQPTAASALGGVLSALSALRPDQLATFLGGAVFGGLFFATLGRAAYGVARLTRTVSRPFVWILRKSKIAPRVVASTRPARGAMIGVHAASRGAPSHYTETEWALAQIDREGASDAQSAALYDFAPEQRLLKRVGLLFRSIDIDPGMTPEELKSAKLNADLVSQYSAQAQRFFSRPVQLDVNEHALYEDAEGAVAINLFRSTDRRAYFAIDQMRRVINGNAFTLIFGLWLALATPLVALVWAGASPGIAWAVFVPLAAMALVGVMMTLMQNLMYAHQQRQNNKSLNKFLTEYLGYLSDRFRETSAEATRAIQGDKRDAESLEQIAQKWLKVLIWLPFRAFFLESFVRSVKFQIRRNSEYYLWFGYALAALSAVAVFSATASFDNPLVKTGLRAAFLGLTGLYVFLIRRPVILSEINTTTWRGYDNLDVGQQMDHVIGTYAAEIAKWNGRFDRGGPRE